MTIRTKTIGRLPQNKSEWDPNYVNPGTGQRGYGQKFRVYRYGCELESKIENNTYDPFDWDGDQNFVLDVAHWELCSGNPKVWAAGNPKPATTGTTGAHPYNGMGRVVIPKNMVDIAEEGEPENIVNLLTQDAFEDGEGNPLTNTVYVIQYDFELAEDITIPANCVLDFNGGSIKKNGSNDTVTGQNTGIINLGKYSLHDVILDGTYIKQNTVFSYYFDSSYDVNLLLSSLDKIGEEICLCGNRTYNVNEIEVTLEAKRLFSNDKGVVINNHITTNSVSSGVTFISNDVRIDNLGFTDDFNPTQFPDNEPQKHVFLGIYVNGESRNLYNRKMNIENCTFSGHYPGSIISSSYTQLVNINNCRFIDVIAEDHAIYFSMVIKELLLTNIIFDSCGANASGRSGLIKVRDNDANIRLVGCTIHNIDNGSFILYEGEQGGGNIMFDGCHVYDGGDEFNGSTLLANISVDSEIPFNNITVKNSVLDFNVPLTSTSGYYYGAFNLSNTVNSINIINVKANRIPISFVGGSRCSRYSIINSELLNINKQVRGLPVNTVIENSKIAMGIYLSGVMRSLTSDTNTKLEIINSDIITVDSNGLYPSIIDNRGQTGIMYFVWKNSTINGINSITYPSGGATVGRFIGDIDNLNSLVFKDNTIDYNYDNRWLNTSIGQTSERPGGQYIHVGHQYYDTNLEKPIFAKAIAADYTVTWMYADGTLVS